MTTFSPRTIDELYGLVSLAIHRAESADAAGDASGAEATRLEASCLEEEIAELLPVSDGEGAIARRGAVTAALGARQYARALAMADKYLAEPDIDDELRHTLVDLRARADRELAELSALAVDFDPAARFSFAA